MSDHVMVPIAIGELYDKISILEIKLERIGDQSKLKNVSEELKLLNDIAGRLKHSTELKVVVLRTELKTVNKAIWEAENRVRQVAADSGFGEAFAAVARVTYSNNDRRAAIKRELSLLAGSLIIEEKSHTR